MSNTGILGKIGGLVWIGLWGERWEGQDAVYGSMLGDQTTRQRDIQTLTIYNRGAKLSHSKKNQREKIRNLGGKVCDIRNRPLQYYRFFKNSEISDFFPKNFIIFLANFEILIFDF